MRPDKFRRPYQAPRGANVRLRLQIALEAARRLVEAQAPAPGDDLGWLEGIAEADYYGAKRRAAAVLGHRVRPGDLPADSEVRAEIIALVRDRDRGRDGADPAAEAAAGTMPEPVGDAPLSAMAAHLDRFTIYRLRLRPLESVKQNPKYHPEGDALYHSLQVFERAREARPYDEEFLLAALLHDVGKAIDPHGHVAAAVDALRGAVTERTLWLIEHHMDLLARPDRPLSPKARQAIAASEHFDDLQLLRDLDNAGRVPGAPTGTIDEALAYLRGLEREDYLPGGDAADGPGR